jgi:hypothetical protein
MNQNSTEIAPLAIFTKSRSGRKAGHTRPASCCFLPRQQFLEAAAGALVQRPPSPVISTHASRRKVNNAPSSGYQRARVIACNHAAPPSGASVMLVSTARADGDQSKATVEKNAAS